MEEILNLKIYLTKSKRNKDKIIYDGHGYNFTEDHEMLFIWRYCKRNCKSSLKTTKEYNFVSLSEHSYPRDVVKICNFKIIKK